jgi:hypothetical protein
LQQAVAAVEETNRVVGLSQLVNQVHASGQTTHEVMEPSRQKASGQVADGGYVVWGLD